MKLKAPFILNLQIKNRALVVYVHTVLGYMATHIFFLEVTHGIPQHPTSE